MRLPELLKELKRRKVRLWVEDKRLRFSAPKGALTPELRERLKQYKTRILNTPGLKTKTGSGKKSSAADREKTAALSFAQRRLWLIDRLEGNLPHYNIPTVYRLSGPPDVAALESALARIAQRHESLRTTFPVIDGEPMQSVHPPAKATLKLMDLSRLPAPKNEAERARLLHAEAKQPFSLEDFPLSRWSLVRISGREHFLIIVMHHIISDGWSNGVLQRELHQFYDALIHGGQPRLEPLPIQYTDFSQWQHRRFKGVFLKRQLAFWKERLGGKPPLLELPTDRPRPKRQRFRGGLVPVQLDAGLTAQLKALCGRENITPFMALLACFQVLLYRYSGQSTITLGSPIANRNRVEVENLIGFFVNTLVLRLDLPSRPDFPDLLKRVRALTLEAHAHQDLPFEKLVEALQPERDLSRNPLFQVVFVLQNAGGFTRRFGNLAAQTKTLDLGIAHFDLTLSLEATANGADEESYEGVLEYDSDLFNRETAQRMARHFVAVARAVLRHPRANPWELDILDETDRRLLLQDWNQTQSHVSFKSLAQDLVVEAAAKAPDAVAVSETGEAGFRQYISYSALDEEARHLAAHLRGLGVAPETRVGVWFERSIDLVRAALGVFRAGGAYVPLDPAYPRERAAYTLEDSDCRVLISHRDLARGLSDFPAPILQLEPRPFRQSENIGADRANGADFQNLAYIIFTSGSTGRPKGVAISHANLLNTVHWHHLANRVSRATRASMLAGPAFDASVLELWPALITGCSLHIPQRDCTLSPSSLLDWLIDEHISLSFVPTPMAEAMLQEGAARDPGLIRLKLLTGGDRLHLRPRPDFTPSLFNLYGPTECTVLVTAGAVQTEPRDAPPDIGRPISNTRVHALDPYGRLCPPGVRGELQLAGEGLGRGYLNRPRLTAKAFVPDAFCVKPGDRLYRTGDLARHLPNGRLDFFGRIDHQVQLRGFRIEPGEIEHCLNALPSIEAAAVLLRDEGHGNRFLAAFVQPRSDAGPHAELRDQWKTSLKKKLPAYMVPSVFEILEKLPISTSGKVDRSRLADRPLTQGGARLEHELIAPRNDIERGVARI